MGKLPTALLRRPSLLGSRTGLPSSQPSAPPPFGSGASASPATGGGAQQLRRATLVPRPRRPYHFTQLVQLSDGSTFTARTTSPAPLYRSTKDSRNHILWQPSEKSLRNVEVDEAGRLAAFRERFGRSWDAAQAPEAAQGEGGAAAQTASAAEGRGIAHAAGTETADASGEPPVADTLEDLISGYAAREAENYGGLSAKEQAKKDKDKKKK